RRPGRMRRGRRLGPHGCARGPRTTGAGHGMLNGRGNVESKRIGPRLRGQPGAHGWLDRPRFSQSTRHEVSMTAVDNRAEWWSLAACLTADPELFFPISTAGPAVGQVAQAKAICARCPIQQACLGYALNAGPVQGVWGGLTEEERRLLKQRERR